MLSDAAPPPPGLPRLVPVPDLRFDRRSPRLMDLPATASDNEILERLWRDSALEGLAASIAVSGFFPHEPLIVEVEPGGLTVVDGNRRLAAVRALIDRDVREQLRVGDLPPAHPEQLRVLPALVGQRATVWRSLGYRHVSGAQPWRSYGRATYVAWIHEELEVPLDQIAQGLGDSDSGVWTLYRALRVLRAAQRRGVFQLEDRWTSHFPFSLLVDALERPRIQEFVGLARRRGDEELVPEDRLAELAELVGWLFGRRSRAVAPVVRTHDPDLRLLDEVVGSPEALAVLRQGQPLVAAHEAGRDSRLRFRESVLAARRLLQEARGAMPGSVAQQADMLRVVDELAALTRSIRDEMQGEDLPGTHPLLTNS